MKEEKEEKPMFARRWRHAGKLEKAECAVIEDQSAIKLSHKGGAVFLRNTQKLLSYGTNST